MAVRDQTRVFHVNVPYHDGAKSPGSGVGNVPRPVGKEPYLQRFDIYPTDASLHKIDGSDLFVFSTYFGDSCP